MSNYILPAFVISTYNREKYGINCILDCHVVTGISTSQRYVELSTTVRVGINRVHFTEGMVEIVVGNAGVGKHVSCVSIVERHVTILSAEISRIIPSELVENVWPRVLVIRERSSHFDPGGVADRKVGNSQSSARLDGGVCERPAFTAMA